MVVHISTYLSPYHLIWSRTALAVLCLSVASVVLMFMPMHAQAFVYTEDFDDLTVGDPFPSPWTGDNGSIIASDEQSVSTPNSIKSNFSNTVREVAYDLGTTTRGLIQSKVYASSVTNFSGYRLYAGDTIDESGITMLRNGASSVFRCGRIDSGSEDFSTESWNLDTWYTLYVDYQVINDIAGDFVSVRCGYQTEGSGITWSDRIDSNPVVLSNVTHAYASYALGGSGNYFTDDFYIATDTDYDELELGTTRVIEVLPHSRNGSVTATSTAMVTSISGYVHEDDYVAGMKAKLRVFRFSSTQQVSKVQVWETIASGSPAHSYTYEWEITGSGDFLFSTTTDTSEYLTGEYSIVGEISIPASTTSFLSSAWRLLMDSLEKANGTQPAETPIRKVDRFIIGEPTWYDDMVREVTESRDLSLLTLAVCNPLDGSFDISDCLWLLIVPTEEGFNEIWTELYNGVFTKVPFGYVTRFVEIVSFGEATMPPGIEYTYGTSAPLDLQGKTISIQIFDPENIALISSIKSDDLVNPKNIWEIVMPYFDTVIALAVLGVILSDLMRIGVPDFTSSGSSRGRLNARMDTSDIDNMRITDHSRLSEEEWENHKRNRLL